MQLKDTVLSALTNHPPSTLSSPHHNKPSLLLPPTLCPYPHPQSTSNQMATLSSATLPAAGASMRQRTRVVTIEGLSLFGGLKAHNSIASLGLPACTDRSFATVVLNSLKPSKKGGRGGALTSTCNAAAEIFKIAAIMNGLTLIGVAVGFVLLRVEAAVEESE